MWERKRGEFCVPSSETLANKEASVTIEKIIGRRWTLTGARTAAREP